MSELVYLTGDLFSAPEGSILVHACNTVGSWGGGIALVFRDKYPVQFELYKAYCKEHGQSLVGTCLLIPGEKYDIACLFTSRAYGKRKDEPRQILAATKTAVQDLVKQNTGMKKLYACRFNSGKFDVPWDETEAVLRDSNVCVAMTIYTPFAEST